jgi:hypothetical protein
MDCRRSGLGFKRSACRTSPAILGSWEKLPLKLSLKPGEKFVLNGAFV